MEAHPRGRLLHPAAAQSALEWSAALGRRNVHKFLVLVAVGRLLPRVRDMACFRNKVALERHSCSRNGKGPVGGPLLPSFLPPHKWPSEPSLARRALKSVSFLAACKRSREIFLQGQEESLARWRKHCRAGLTAHHPSIVAQGAAGLNRPLGTR